MLSRHFNWSYVGPQTYQLSWDTEGLAKPHADGISLHAMPVDSSRCPIIKVGSFSLGEITFKIRDPGKSYVILFDALKGNDRVLHYVKTIKTLSTSKLVLMAFLLNSLSA